MDRSYTLSFDNQYAEEMLKTFMACQFCRNVNTKIKQLQCGHTICLKCAIASSKRQGEKWLLRCSTCRKITTCYDEKMSSLKDIKTVQKLVEKSRPTYESALFNNAPQRSEENMSINVVSSTREKQEIQKVLETAKRKMHLCHDQRKLVHHHEKRVQSAKIKLENQIKESVDSFIFAIRTHQDHLLDELNQLFKEDFQPIEEAVNCLEMQMQSFKLVTECCSVAGKILKGGGAPMDMNNFKKMVRQTMGKTKASKLPSAIQKSYKPRVFYKSNEDQYDEMAERIGKLVVRKEKKQHVQGREMEKTKTREVVVKKEEYREMTSTEYAEDEPIYDRVPVEMLDDRHPPSHKQDYEEPGSFYNEIPFFNQRAFQPRQMESEASSIIASFVSQTQNEGNRSYISPTSSLATSSTAQASLPPPPPFFSAISPADACRIASTTIPPPPAPPLPTEITQVPNVTSVPIPPPPPVPVTATPARLQMESVSTAHHSTSYCHLTDNDGYDPPPSPIAKNNHTLVSNPNSGEPQSTILPSTSSAPCAYISEDAVALFAKRRRAINGYDSEFDSDSEQSITDSLASENK